MFNHVASARISENIYLMRSKRVYARLDDKSDETLHRYYDILQPKGLLNSFLALFDSDRQLKISCLEDILSSRQDASKKNLNETESQNVALPTCKGVNIMTSDQDMKSVNEQTYRENHSFSTILTPMLSRGYRK